MPVTGEDISTAIGAITKFGQKRKTEKSITNLIEQAKAQGMQIEYKVDPATGQVTPSFKSQAADPYADLIKQSLGGQGGFEVGGITKTAGGKSSVSLKPKKDELAFTDQDIRSAEILASEGGRHDAKGLSSSRNMAKIPILGGKQTLEFDLSKDAGRRKAAGARFGEDWETNPKLARLKEILDARATEEEATAGAAKAKTEKKIEPVKKGLARIGKGAEYKEAIAKYDEAKVTKIVDMMIKQQSKGVPLEKIRAWLEDVNLDPELFLKFYK